MFVDFCSNCRCQVFHPGTSSGGVSSDEGGGDMPYSWSEPYWFCDQFYNGTVQSLAMQQWPANADGSPARGCVQSAECVECMTAAGSITPTGKQTWSAANCSDECYPDGLVAQNTIEQLEYAAAHKEARPFFIASGMKRPHMGWFAPDSFFQLYPNSSVRELDSLPSAALMDLM